MSRIARCVAMIIVCCSVYAVALNIQGASAQTAEQRFFDWTSQIQDPVVYQQRRSRMISHLKSQGIDLVIVPGAHGVSHGPTFRQTDDFMYFTGLELPYSILVIDAAVQRSVVFSPARDTRFASASRTNDFPGRPLADDPEIARRSGLDEVRIYEEFESALALWIDEGKSISVNNGRTGDIRPASEDFIMDVSPVTTLIQHIVDLHPGIQIENAFDSVARLRMVKQSEEIEAMRAVASLTVDAISYASGFVRDGVDERTLEAELESVYKRGGAQRLSFASIIKSGPNSLWPWRILATHNDRRNRIMTDGELVIFDVGTELNYYISDVGRTFPVSGKFSVLQKEKLTMMTNVADAIIAAVRPGITLPELRKIAVNATPESERQYMQTGSYFGHHIGMAAGDPSLLDVPLEPGMIFTVEPWYYNHDLNISVFVEDIILVTGNGSEVLTAALPRTAEELERMVR